MVRVGLRGDAFDLGDGNHGKVPNEQQETCEEQTERSDVRADVNIGWRIIAPTRRQKIAVQPNYNNDESFEPHPDVYQDRNDKHEPQFLPAPVEPEHL